jgi:hypothetical protein
MRDTAGQINLATRRITNSQFNLASPGRAFMAIWMNSTISCPMPRSYRTSVSSLNQRRSSIASPSSSTMIERAALLARVSVGTVKDDGGYRISMKAVGLPAEQ